MRIFALPPVLLGTFGLLMAACGSGGEGPPAESASSHSFEPPDGSASEGDPYAGFDGGSLGSGPDDPPAAEQPATGSDLGAACQQAAQAWEKRARPQIKACYREGKKKDPNLMGTARIVVDVGFDGKPKPAKLDGISSLGDDVAQCMVDAVSKTSFPEGEACKTRQLTIPVEFPTPH